MEHPRGFGLRTGVLALLIAAVGAGCGGGDTPSVADTGVTDDVGKTDVTMPTDNGTPNDTGGGTDSGGTDTGPVDAGETLDASDAGAPTDTGLTDGATPSDGGGDGGVGPDGGTRRARAGASLVSAGSLMRSASFQMISTLGGRSVQQTTLQSPNFRLRGGLVGTIGAR
jgi:hypothetical protein